MRKMKWPTMFEFLSSNLFTVGPPITYHCSSHAKYSGSVQYLEHGDPLRRKEKRHVLMQIRALNIYIHTVLKIDRVIDATSGKK